MKPTTRNQVAEALLRAASVLASKPASKAQVDYALHLVKQQGLSDPTEEQVRGMDDRTISDLIDGLKAKRGRPVWYGNGQFSHWEK